MASNSKSQEAVLKLWTLLHRVRDRLVLCEDSIFSEFGLTMEQFALLAAVRAWDGSLRPSELAAILGRSPNSVSMLVDRMVKDGLVKRTRDRKDRRVVNVSLTGKGEKAVVEAAPAGWELFQKLLSPVSDKDRHALVGLLETIKCECVGYLNPKMDMADVIKNSVTNRRDLYKEWTKTFPSAGQARRQDGKKGKTR